MSNVSLFRGGTPDFKGWFCDGQYAEFLPPFDAPHMDYTPPFDSHADAAQGQGYLNLPFPLVPRLNDTTGHHWQSTALRKLAVVGDIIRLAWVPLRSYLDSLYVEVTKFDANLDGVYVIPTAERVAWNFTTNEWDYLPNADFDTDVVNLGTTTQLPLGTPAGGDKPYFFMRFVQNGNTLPSTFGHNIVARDAQGQPTGGLDAAFGAVMLGLKVIDGDPVKIANIWRSDFALYFSSKLLAFESPTQIG